MNGEWVFATSGFLSSAFDKKAWRLLVFPDSFCAKVMKAKYYPHGHLIDTVFPQATSLTWQGIMHGLELLKKALFGEWSMGLV